MQLNYTAYHFQLHIVNYNFDKYESIAEAVMEPLGLAVLGVMFEVSSWFCNTFVSKDGSWVFFTTCLVTCHE